jgi:hypothetical protein
MSVLDFLHLGSSLSLRSFARVGSAVSLRGAGWLGSSLSLRSFARVGSAVSVRGLSRFGSVFSMSVLDFLHLGSSLSLRSFARLGSSISVKGTTAVQNVIQFDSSNSGTLEFQPTTGSMDKSLTLSATGGTLHGIWVADYTLTSSDRRLKQDISPLLTDLLSVPDEQETDAASEPSAWLLRQLRPVSFVRSSQTKKDGKSRREYGFIAQDLEKLLPDIVQPLQPGQGALIGQDDLKGVAYIDLIALLTAFAQQEMLRRERTDDSVGLLRRKVAELEEAMDQYRDQLSAALERERREYRDQLSAALERERRGREELSLAIGVSNRTIESLKEEVAKLLGQRATAEPAAELGRGTPPAQPVQAARNFFDRIF